MSTDTPASRPETAITPPAGIERGFGRAPSTDPVDAAIERHRAAWARLQRATNVMDAAALTGRRIEAETRANVAFDAVSVADGEAWADLLATRPGDIHGAVRLLRYVAGSPETEIVPDAQDLLRQLTAAVEAAEVGAEQGEGRDEGAAPTDETVAPGAPDPALAVAAEFQASWKALGEAIDAAGGAGVPEVDPAIEDREGAAYERLKTVRPTTPEGFRALAGAWAMVLGGERMDEPGLQHADYAADSLIAGAGVCVPVRSVDWTKPPPGFIASPVIEPFGFARIPEGIAIELRRLHGIAVSEFERRAGWPSMAEGTERLRRELRLDALAKAVRGEGSFDVGAGSVSANGSDPVHALIAEHRAAFADWEPLAAVWNEMASDDPGYTAAVDASNEPGKREAAAFDALFTARPTTLAGAAALASYFVEAVRRTRIDARSTDGERALGIVSTTLDGLVRGNDTAPDPVLAAIAASRHAEGEMAAFQDSLDGPLTTELRERENTLCEVQNRTRDAVWATVPTTRAGRLALIDYARFQACVHAGATGIIDNALKLFEEVLAPIAAAVVAERPEATTADGPGHDLASLPLAQLAHLYEALEPFEDLIGRAENAPCFWDAQRTNRTPAGDIIYREAARLDRLLRDIVKEIERRRPADDGERDERLRVLVRRATSLDGLTTDRALLTEALAACED